MKLNIKLRSVLILSLSFILLGSANAYAKPMPSKPAPKPPVYSYTPPAPAKPPAPAPKPPVYSYTPPAPVYKAPVTLPPVFVYTPPAPKPTPAVYQPAPAPAKTPTPTPQPKPDPTPPKPVYASPSPAPWQVNTASGSKLVADAQNTIANTAGNLAAAKDLAAATGATVETQKIGSAAFATGKVTGNSDVKALAVDSAAAIAAALASGASLDNIVLNINGSASNTGGSTAKGAALNDLTAAARAQAQVDAIIAAGRKEVPPIYLTADNFNVTASTKNSSSLTAQNASVSMTVVTPPPVIQYVDKIIPNCSNTPSMAGCIKIIEVPTCLTNPSLCTPPPVVKTCATDASLCPPPAKATCATDASLCPPPAKATCATDASLCPPPAKATCATDASLCPPPVIPTCATDASLCPPPVKLGSTCATNPLLCPPPAALPPKVRPS